MITKNAKATLLKKATMESLAQGPISNPGAVGGPPTAQTPAINPSAPASGGSVLMGGGAGVGGPSVRSRSSFSISKERSPELLMLSSVIELAVCYSVAVLSLDPWLPLQSESHFRLRTDIYLRRIPSALPSVENFNFSINLALVSCFGSFLDFFSPLMILFDFHGTIINALWYVPHLSLWWDIAQFRSVIEQHAINDPTTVMYRPLLRLLKRWKRRNAAYRSRAI